MFNKVGSQRLFIIGMNKIIDNLFKEVSLVIKDKGYYIDNISYAKSQGKNKRSKLLIIISRLDNTPISIKDCTIVSKFISMIIDVKNLIDEAYILEVSSKGCDDSLFFFNDFVKNIGRLVRVNLKNSETESDFTGTIIKATGSKIFFKKHFNNESKNITVSINNIKSAILIRNMLEGEFNERSTRIG